MRHTFLLCGLLSLANLAFADHHQLAIDARQPIVELDVTSVTLGDDTSVINAESKMGVYGRVYRCHLVEKDRLVGHKPTLDALTIKDPFAGR